MRFGHLVRALTVLGCGVAAAYAAGPTWQQLSAQQRAALAPLEREWPAIDDARKRKWLEIAERMPRMSPDERERVQGRMGEWARMSPDERARVRRRYQESLGISAQERQQRWEAYQALPAERRGELAQGARTARPEPRNESAPQVKSNIVPNSAHLPPPKQVAPAVVQAQPGATTRLMSRPPAPPPHQQTGLPKIAAQPGFVDPATLLPQRGPQAAAARPLAAGSSPRTRER